MDNRYDCLKLENQICFPLYAASRAMTKRYTPLLKELDLTYTQYITMMVMWDKKRATVGEIGEKLFLDSGTLTPLLKTLEKKGYIARDRNKEDERVRVITLTEKGESLKDKAVSVPPSLAKEVSLTEDEAKMLYSSLYKIISDLG